MSHSRAPSGLLVYDYLPMTAANQNLLSVTAQHPSARIDTNPSDAPAGSAIK